MSLAPLMGLPGKVKTMLDRLTATRASNLDNLDSAVSTRAPASTALSSSVWTPARASKIDTLATATSITTLQSSVNTVDTVVDGIASSVAALPTGSISKSFHSTVTASASATTYNIALGATYDRSKSIVQVSDPDPGQASTNNALRARWFWDSASQIQVEFIDSTGAVVGLSATNTFDVTVMEFN